MRTRHRQSGSSLVEVFITASVAVVALVATMAATINGSKVAQTTAETRAATRAATSIAEQMRSTPFAELPDLFDGQSFDVSALTGTETNAVATVVLSDIETGSTNWLVREARISVNWTGTTGASSFDVVTYIGNGRGVVGIVSEEGLGE